MNILRPHRREQGFTLVEAIVVMVLTAILAGIAVLFIRRPVQGYVESAGRADMADVAEIALRRMARELHGALPNSVRLLVIGNTSLLEFIPTKSGGIYLSEEDGIPVSAQTPPLSFTDINQKQFRIVGPVPAAPYAIAVNDYIVVYNLGPGFDGADAYAGSNRARVAGVAAANNGGIVVSFGGPNGENTNPFAAAAAAGVPNKSPGKRFNVVTGPVTFACESDPATGRGRLTRYWNYGFQPNQPDPSKINNVPNALMADSVFGCQFSVQQLANQNTALIGLSIALARAGSSANGPGLETATLSQQIHVDNTP